MQLLQSDDEDVSETSSVTGGVAVNGTGAGGLKVNREYARRFEHNQKRAELHRLQEKYGKSNGTAQKQRDAGTQSGEDSESSTDQDEDDEGALASGRLDQEYLATLQAIRNKDPRVYKADTKFYTTEPDDAPETEMAEAKKEKPIYLADYHRKNLLESKIGAEDEGDGGQPLTYTQEQDKLKSDIVREINTMKDDGTDNEDAEDEYFVQKTRPITQLLDKPTTSSRVAISSEEVDSADKDPETYLSRFLQAKAWIPNSESKWQPFESDDEEEDRRADEFEEAYNLRFEDPEHANEKLTSYARDSAAKYSVRQETTKKRKRARDTDRLKKEEQKSERSEEKNRLRKLRIEEAEAKLKKIKDAAGLSRGQLKVEDWKEFIEEDWDDDKWEREMNRRFGDEYYAEKESEHSDEEARKSKKRKLKKPRWNDDIDIKDLVPDFVESDAPSLTGDENEDEDGDEDKAEDENGASRRPQKKWSKKKEREEQKRDARRERRQVEALVDSRLDLDMAVDDSAGSRPGAFLYRETSPTAYGLTPQDILLASDSQLNQYAGLKKMAAFRDDERKRRDRKKLSKKARLRQWRKETFGSENGPMKSLQDVLKETELGEERSKSKADTVRGKKSRRGKRVE